MDMNNINSAWMLNVNAQREAEERAKAEQQAQLFAEGARANIKSEELLKGQLKSLEEQTQILKDKYNLLDQAYSEAKEEIAQNKKSTSRFNWVTIIIAVLSLAVSVYALFR